MARDELHDVVRQVREAMDVGALAALDQLLKQGKDELAQFVGLSREIYEGCPDWTVATSLTLFGMSNSEWSREYAIGVAALAVCELARRDVEA